MTKRTPWTAITLYLLGIMMGALDTGIVTPARPLIADALGVDESAGIWMITVYTLAYAAAIPVVGKLADRHGRKPVFLASIALFGIGSLLCGLSQDFGSFPMLIAARAIQAIGAGGILPIATAEISSEVPPEKRGMALGLVGAVFGVANIFGASAGSLILDIAGPHNWQWIFYVNLPIAAAIVAIGWFKLPNPDVEETKPVDAIGTLLLVGIILSLLYGIKNLDFFNFAASLRSPSVWPFLVGCAVALPLFILAERRAADPVLNLRYFTDRGIGLTLLLSMLSGMVMMAVVFVPQLAENAMRMEAGTGGYFVIILGLASAVGAPVSGKLTDRFGPKVVLGFGFGMSAVAAAVVVWWMIPHPSLSSTITSLALLGLGLGFVVGSPLSYMMLERTSEKESSSALGTLSLVRSIGVTLAPAIMVGFVVQGTSGLQSSLLAELPTTIQVPALPYAQELDQRFKAWKSDERFADNLAGVDLPDLTKTEIQVDLEGGSGLPADLVDLLKTADVTNITERTKTVAERMFRANTPETIATIQSGVDTGIDGVRTALASTADSRQKMTDGLADMDSQLAQMSDGLAGMDSSLAEMNTGIKGMDSSLAEMNTGIDGMDSSLAEMNTGIKKMDASLSEMNDGVKGMDDGLAGLDEAIAGVKQPIAELDRAIAGMDAGLAQQKAKLADLQALPDPPADEIAALEASIEQAQGERDAAWAQRDTLQAKLDGLNAQRAQLAKKRSDLVSARAELTKQRDKLADGRAELTAQRRKLVEGRAALTEQRAKLVEGRDALTAQRADLADGKSQLTKARADLAAGRDELDASRAEMQKTIDELGVLRDAVPGAFEQALQDYLAEIDARGPQLEAAFESAVGDGYHGVFLFDLVVCLLALAALAFVPAVRRPEEQGPEGEATTEPVDNEPELAVV